MKLLDTGNRCRVLTRSIFFILAERITFGRWLIQVLADRAAKSIWTEALNTVISRTFQDHVCQVNGDCLRFLELMEPWFSSNITASAQPRLNLYRPGMWIRAWVLNESSQCLQDVDSNYRTDLLWSLIQTTQELTGQTDEQREANFTPYRVIADHARAAAFLIADGVVAW